MEKVLSRLQTSLTHKISVYVPATVDVAESADNSAAVHNMAAFLSKCFGGATACPVTGYWLSDQFGLVSENTVVVYAFATETDFVDCIEAVIDTCETLKTAMSQEAVALEIDGKMYFV